jgi:acyl-CoA reductase-like NAD-dependent aldehyde dehydrogenase
MQSDNKLTIRNPATNEVITELPMDDAKSVAAKFMAAKEAQKDWEATPFVERHKIIKKFNELLVERLEECSQIMMKETGKPIALSRNEVRATPPRVQFFLDHTEKVTANRDVVDDGSMRETISFDPLGVVANISAWNFPYFVGTNVFIPALLTGSAVLYKPSEFATMTGQAMVDLMHEAGVPNDVFQLVVGQGDAGAALLEQPIDGVFFTGSYRTGKKIAETVAGRMMKVQLELGGKDPSYICDDMDPQAAAANALDGACYNAGQSCCAVERVYVHGAIHDQFVDELIKAAASVVIGDPQDDQTYLGPMTQAQHIEELEAQVEDAIGKGARLLHGGKRVAGRPGYFEPTVLTKVTHDMKVMTEESFGPIIPVMKVEDDAEAIRLMNDTTYGLTASIYTKDESRARKVLASINAGTVYWNCCDRVSPFLPWSGRGHSGVGWTLSNMGIETFLKPKAWHMRQP